MPQNKKKKQPKNAFYFFMVDYRRQQEVKGVTFPGGLKEVADKAAPIWKTMHVSDRLIYEEEARKEKERDKANRENKFTTHGKSYAQVERETNEAVNRQMRMTQEIEGIVRSLDYYTSLRTYAFYLIHVNYYCQQENGMYIPCEMALAEFTFVDGVRRVYHTLINPGTIPLGYKYEADKNSSETHNIPVPPDEFGGETDYVKILLSVKRFLTGKSGDASIIPPLYTQPQCIDAAKNVLSRLEDSVRTDYSDESDMFRVYPLPKLFFELRNACVSHKPGAAGFPVLSLAERELEKDVFSFTKGISCEFHEAIDAQPYCSLSCVRRWGYVIMDHCCKDLGIELVLGQHCPRQADTSRHLKLATQFSDAGEDVSPPRSVSSVVKPSFVDCDRLSPDHSSAQHITLLATPGIVSINKQPDPEEPAHQEPLTRLRQPKAMSVAVSLLAQPELKEEDFPSLGSSKKSYRGAGAGIAEPAGVMRNEPVAVAGRGKLAAKLFNPISLGRGRGLAANLETDFSSMQLDQE